MRKPFQQLMFTVSIILTTFNAQATANLSTDSRSFSSMSIAVEVENVGPTYVCTFTIDITGGVNRIYRGEGRTLSDAQWKARSACLADFDAGICLMGAYECSSNN